MTATVDYLPIWKRDATSEERLLELAAIANKHPERFNKLAVVYEQKLPNGNTVVRQISADCNLAELLGLLELGKNQAIIDSLK